MNKPKKKQKTQRTMVNKNGCELRSVSVFLSIVEAVSVEGCGVFHGGVDERGGFCRVVIVEGDLLQLLIPLHNIHETKTDRHKC